MLLDGPVSWAMQMQQKHSVCGRRSVIIAPGIVGVLGQPREQRPEHELEEDHRSSPGQ